MLKTESETSNDKKKNWKLRRFIFMELLNDLEVHFSMLKMRYMPVKGAYLIISGIAEKIEYRRMADIDILIDEECMKNATDYFFKLPNVTPKAHYATHYTPHETQFLYKIGNFKALIELHTHINCPERFSMNVSETFERGYKLTSFKILPCPEDALIIYISHLFTSFFIFTEEPDFNEITLIITHCKFNWQKFWDISYTTGIDGFIFLILKMYQNNYVPVPFFPREHLYSRLQAIIISKTGFVPLPLWYKRLFCELPYLKNPLYLTKRKLKKWKRNMK
jgi:hypothetical protein